MSGKFYVYTHSRETTGEVFYVGKGCGRRAWKEIGRNDYWHRVRNKHGLAVRVVASGLSEACAFSIERAIIGRLGRDTLTNYTDGGEGTSGAIVSEEARDKKRGFNNPSYDPNQYRLTHDEHGEIWGTQIEIKAATGLRDQALSCILKGRIHSAKGWYVPGTKPWEPISGEDHPSHDPAVYEIEHATMGRRSGTRVALMKECGLTKHGMYRLVKGINSIHRGWFLPSNPPKKYVFSHVDHGAVSGSQVEISSQSGLNSSQVSAIVNGRRNHCKGWSLLSA